jgi:hypothetical protein
MRSSTSARRIICCSYWTERFCLKKEVRFLKIDSQIKDPMREERNFVCILMLSSRNDNVIALEIMELRHDPMNQHVLGIQLDSIELMTQEIKRAFASRSVH